MAHSKKQEVLRLRIENSFQQLKRLKKQKNRESFNKELLELLPDIKKHINRRLTVALKKEYFPKNKYSVDDFVNQLFIEVYDNIDTVKEEKHLYLWLFKKTNELLEDVIVEEEFDDFFFKNIDTYSKLEWDAMEQEFSVDAGRDFVMMEEFDDVSYSHEGYTLNHVFVEDNKKALIDKIDKSLDDKTIANHLKTVLYNLPLSMQDVYELYAEQKFSLAEIAEIRNMAVEDVETLLKDVRKALQVSLFNRYPAQ